MKFHHIVIVLFLVLVSIVWWKIPGESTSSPEAKGQVRAIGMDIVNGLLNEAFKDRQGVMRPVSNENELYDRLAPYGIRKKPGFHVALNPKLFGRKLADIGQDEVVVIITGPVADKAYAAGVRVSITNSMKSTVMYSDPLAREDMRPVR